MPSEDAGRKRTLYVAIQAVIVTVANEERENSVFR
jgi:hypothetical protein